MNGFFYDQTSMGDDTPQSFQIAKNAQNYLISQKIQYEPVVYSDQQHPFDKSQFEQNIEHNLLQLQQNYVKSLRQANLSAEQIAKLRNTLEAKQSRKQQLCNIHRQIKEKNKEKAHNRLLKNLQKMKLQTILQHQRKRIQTLNLTKDILNKINQKQHTTIPQQIYHFQQLVHSLQNKLQHDNNSAKLSLLIEQQQVILENLLDLTEQMKIN